MPEVTKSPSHLFRRGSTFYFRLAIPDHLRHIVGQREIRMSLGTSYLYQARRIATRLHSNGLEFFQEIETMPDNITEQKLKELKAKFFHDQIMIDEALRLKVPHRSQIALQQSMESLEELKKELRLELASGQLATGKARLLKHLVYNSLDPALDGVADEKIYLEITKALADAVEVMLHRKQGDFDFEETIMEKYAIHQQQPAATAPAVPQPSRKSMRLSELIKKHCNNRINSGRWKKKSLPTYEGRLEWSLFILGDIDVSEINFAMMEDFRDKLVKMPRNRKKSKKYRDMSLQEILASEVDVPLAPKGVNNILGAINTMFKYAIQLEVMDKNHVSGLLVKDKGPKKKRPPFTPEDLQLIFHPQEHIDRYFDRPERFWIPVLSLLLGSRLEEISQLHLADIRDENGEILICINEEAEDASVKNDASERRLPLHPVLRDTLNFPGFVSKMRKSKAKRLFPGLNLTKAERYGGAVSSWLDRKLKKTGIKEADKRKCFHCLRHTFIVTADRLDGLEDKYTVGVTGHSRKGDNVDSAYIEKFPPEILYDKVLSRIGDFGLDWDKIAESKFVVKR